MSDGYSGVNAEANKEQSDHAIILAKNALAEGDKAKAIRLLEKSLRLYNNEPASVLLNKLKTNPPSSSENNPKFTNKEETTPPRTKRSFNSEQEEVTKDYTAEQENDVKMKLKVKDFYELLNIKRDATNEEIKKSYRKMALKYHPDKNSAPGADDAFKAVSTAYRTLSDPAKRKHYDMYGTTEERVPGMSTSNSFYADDLSDETIFEMFYNEFGLRFERPARYGRYRNRTRAYFQRPTRSEANSERSHDTGAQLLQFVPLIIVLLISLFSYSGPQNTYFSLSPTSQFSIQMKTRAGTPYYVGRQFSRYFGRDPRALAQIEESVDLQAFDQVKIKCDEEKKEKRKLEKKMKNSKSIDRKERLEILLKFETESMMNCKKIENMYNPVGVDA